VSGFADLDAYIAKLHKLSGFNVEVAKAAAPKVEAVVQASAAAGTSPSGQAWAPTKDGKRALPKAGGAVRALSKGATITILLSGHYTWHQNSKNHPREIIPERGKGVPAPISEAIKEASREVFFRTMGGR
jgi:hypothetical protein